jgi:HTH-type transcriptional regulator/antitoxin HigA
MIAELDFAVPTGEYIEEWLEDEGITQAELARRLAVSRKHVSELVSGKAALSHPVALALEVTTGVPSRIWNQYESAYRDALARLQRDQEYADQYDRAAAYPLAALRKLGILTASGRDRAGTVRELLAFFGVASLDALDATWARGSVAYRREARSRDQAPKLETWLRIGERAAEADGDLPDFDREALTSMLPELRACTKGDPPTAIPEAIGALRTVGVRTHLTPAIPGVGVHGATRWFRDAPLVQLSALRKSDDQFWFTLFHELGHVLCHSRMGLFLDADASQQEEEANRFSSDLLIPPKSVADLPRGRNIAAVREMADSLGIAPSIVLGRAQRETGDFAWGHALRRNIDLQEISDRLSA